MKPASLTGIQERSLKFVDRLQGSLGGSHDIFVSPNSP